MAVQMLSNMEIFTAYKNDVTCIRMDHVTHFQPPLFQCGAELWHISIQNPKLKMIFLGLPRIITFGVSYGVYSRKLAIHIMPAACQPN